MENGLPIIPNRTGRSADSFVGSSIAIDRMLVAYLCRTEKQAHAVRLWRVDTTNPTAEEVRTKKRSIGDDEGSRKQFVAHIYCGSYAS